MDRDNKYYSLIEDLVKKHKKFPGYEAILDEIVDDVYSHAEVIIKSVNNESVIQAYLEKTISTSLITVPKRMNFHKEIKHREIKTEDISKNSYQNEQVQVEIPEKKAPSELVDKMINSSFEDVIGKEEPVNEVSDVSDDVLDEFFAEDMQTVESDTVDDNDNKITDTVTDDKFEADFSAQESSVEIEPDINAVVNDYEGVEEPEVEETSEVYDNFDKTEVEELSDDINNFDETQDGEDFEISENIPEFDNDDADTNVSEDFNSVLSENEGEAQNSSIDSDINEIASNEIIESYDNGAESLEFNNSDDSPEVALDIVDDTSVLEYSEPDETYEENVEDNNDVEVLELSDNNAETDDVSDNNDLNITEPFEVSDELPTVSETEDNSLLEIGDSQTDSSDDLSLDTDVDFDIKQTELVQDDLSDNLVINDTEQGIDFNINDAEMLTPVEELENGDFTLDFNAASDVLVESDTVNDAKSTDLEEIKFDYIPQNDADSVDVDVIVSDVLKLNKEYPDLNIIKVYELRYNNHYKVDKIAEELGMQKNYVIAALNKLVGLV